MDAEFQKQLLAEREEARQNEIGDCLRRAKSPDARVRSAANSRLGELAADAQPLLDALSDVDPHVREAAARGLGNATIGDQLEQVVDQLLAAIDDPNQYVVTGALNSLGQLHALGARYEIIDCLSDKNAHIVHAATIALARLGITDEDGPRLMPFLDSEDALVREAAVRAMGILDYRPAATKVFEQAKATLTVEFPPGIKIKVMRDYITALACLQVQAAVPWLCSIALNEVGLRSIAIKALLDLDSTAALPTLMSLLATPDHSVRIKLLQLIRQCGHPAMASLIRPLLRDQAQDIRSAALELLTEWQDRESIPHIRQICYFDQNSRLRPQAVTSLVNMVGLEALPDLLAVSHDSNTMIRQAVADGLGRINPLPLEAVQILEDMLNDAYVADNARRSLEAWQLNGAVIAPLLPSHSMVQTLLPNEVLGQAKDVSKLLLRWQTHNHSALVGGSSEAIGIDQALACLLTVLNRALLESAANGQ
jgi:HEAT repeat protein